MQMARIKKGLLIAMSIFLVMACTEQKITEVSFDPGDVVPQEVLDTMNIDRYFTISEIPDTIFEFMQGRSYKEDCIIPRSDLRYLIILHRNMDGQAVVGELVVNKEISADILDIMRELYELNYPIEQVRLVDYYEGDDELSMAANNSSAFNWRTQTGSSAKISKHATGMAIDINPLYNPYYRFPYVNETVSPGGDLYMDRMWEFPFKIDEDDDCYRIFTEHGFKWGGSWNSLRDYQHFEK
jgi:hypothetical protein